MSSETKEIELDFDNMTGEQWNSYFYEMLGYRIAESEETFKALKMAMDYLLTLHEAKIREELDV